MVKGKLTARLTGGELERVRVEGWNAARKRHEEETAMRQKMAAQYDKELAAMFDDVYTNGATPDIVWMTLENAHQSGLIGCWEYQWRKALRWLSGGITKLSARFGGRSAPPTAGTRKTA